MSASLAELKHWGIFAKKKQGRGPINATFIPV